MSKPWVKADVALGRKWWAEYALFCLGTCIATAGALAHAYNLGRAHGAFEHLGVKS